MRRTLFTFFLTFQCLIIYAQIVDFHSVKIRVKKEITGKMKGFDSYNLKSFILYIGWENKDVKAFIKPRNNDEIKFKFDKTTDAMIIKPVFFENPENKTLVIMLELAAEFSWGQKLVLIKNDTVYDCGYLDYLTNEGNGESIAKYAKIKQDKDKIILSFQPQYFVDGKEKLIKSQTLKYLLTEKGLKQIK